MRSVTMNSISGEDGEGCAMDPSRTRLPRQMRDLEGSTVNLASASVGVT